MAFYVYLFVCLFAFGGFCQAYIGQAIWEGRLNTGEDIYIRYRWSEFGYGVGWSDDEAIDRCEYYPFKHVSDGWMTTTDMLEVIDHYGITLAEGVEVSDPYGDMSLDDWRRDILDWPEEDVQRWSNRGIIRAEQQEG